MPGGCTDIRCLQIDHINGNGLKKRKEDGGYMKAITHYVNHPEETKGVLQLLCANCNWIKKFDNKENPKRQ